MSPFDDAEWSELRQYTQQQRAWGSDRFRQQIEALTLRAATARPRGRLRKALAAEEKMNLTPFLLRTLWEGRFKAALVDTARYTLACYRYIELNPVRAHMVEKPSGYPWHSYHANALGQPDPLLTPHQTYLALGKDDTSRRAAYRAWIIDTFDDAEWSELRQYTQQQRAWGSDRFRRQVEALTLRATTVRPRGRPKKALAAEEK